MKHLAYGLSELLTLGLLLDFESRYRSPIAFFTIWRTAQRNRFLPLGKHIVLERSARLREFSHLYSVSRNRGNINIRYSAPLKFHDLKQVHVISML